MKSLHTSAGMLLCLVLAWSGRAALAAEPVQDRPTAPASAARLPPSREQVERRLVSVETLIEKSSAAKQVEASAHAPAAALRDKARALRQQAGDAFRASDYVAASRLLDDAAKVFFEGVRLAAPEQVTGEKAQRDFANRLESVKALLVAQQELPLAAIARAFERARAAGVQTLLNAAPFTYLSEIGALISNSFFNPNSL